MTISQGWGSLKVKVAKGWKRHPKSALLLILFVFTFATLWIAFQIDSTIPRTRAWIETLNGATWPSDWEQMWCETPGLFSAAVALRTTINFAGAVSVIAAIVWFFFGGLERYMQMSRLEQLRMLSAELVPTLVAVIQHRHPDTTINVDDQVAMQEIADSVIGRWVHDIEELERHPG